MNSLTVESPETKKRRRGSTGEKVFVDMFKKPIKRKDSNAREEEGTNDAKEEDDSQSDDEVEEGKRVTDKKKIRSSGTLAGAPLSSSPKEEIHVKRTKVGKSKNYSCNDVSQLAEIGSPPSEKKQQPTSPTLGHPTTEKDIEKDSSSRKKSCDPKDSKMKRGSAAYMQNKFDLPAEEAEHMVRDFRSVLHKKVIHHGVMYIYPNYICWLSNSHSTKAKIPFALVTNIRKNPMSVTVEIEYMNGHPKIYKFSHLYKKTVTHKVLTLVWRHSKGDKTISLDEIRSNKTLQDISLDPHTQDAESDGDTEEHDEVVADTLNDEDIVMPPVCAQGEKPPAASYDKGPLLSVVFPVSIAKFWHYLLSDESQHYIDAHIAKGDKDPTLTPWEMVDGRFQRVLEVKADVKSKVIKGFFPIHSVQKCYMLDASHMIKEAESTQEGVPYSSDFINKGYWEITALSKNSTEVKIWLYVVFVKSPLVKGFIEKSSISGMKDFTVVWLGEAHKKLKKLSRPPNKGGEKGAEGASTSAEEEGEEEVLQITGVEPKGASAISRIFSFLTGDWKLMVIVLLFGLIVIETILYVSLQRENERLLAGVTTTTAPPTPNTDIDEGWRQELQALQQLATKLQEGIESLAARKK